MRFGFGAVLAVCGALSAQAEEATMIVLDASGSMWGQIDGVNKIVIARDVVRETLPAAAQGPLGLVSYGHNRKGDCSDIEVLVPPAAGTAGAIAASVDAINPKGKTPLSDAVQRAAQAMGHEENKATVVLVTDGLETCGAAPCALARALEASGVDFTAHVVGFGLSRQDGAAVSCLASETGGRYFEADNQGELAAALSLAVAQEITPETVIEEPPQVEPKHNLQINVQLSPDSPPLENGEIDKLALDLVNAEGRAKNIGYSPVMAIKAEAGSYTLRAKYAGGEVAVPVEIEQFDTAHATLVLDAGVVNFTARPLAPDLVRPDILSWRVTNVETGARQERYVPELRSVFRAGTYEVIAIPGRKDRIAPPPQIVQIVAGEVVTGTVDMPHGGLRIDNVSETGARLPDSFIRFALWSAKDDGSVDRMIVGLNGTRDVLLALPGDYVLVAEDWGITRRKLSQPITIAPGTLTTLRIVMPADEAAPLVVR